MRALLLGCLTTLLLVSCETRQSSTIVQEKPTAKPETAARPMTQALQVRPDTFNVSSPLYTSDRGKVPTDTIIKIGMHQYHLQMSAQTDSSQQLGSARPEASMPDSGTVSAELKYYNAKYTIGLTDSVGHRLFGRTFTKPVFYQTMSKELVVESFAIQPEFIGFNAPRKLLLFRQVFAVDGTDWVNEAFLALDLKGQVRQLQNNNTYDVGGGDCGIQQAPDGQAALTCHELLLPNGRRQSLHKVDGLLVAARFLSDTTVLAVYDFATAHLTASEYYKEPIARYRQAPNAFILSARTGKTIARFRHDGYYEAMGYTLPRCYTWQTKTYYLLDDVRQRIRIIPKNHPQLTTEVSIIKLPKFKKPKHSNEIKVLLSTESSEAALYVDTVTQKMRFHLLENGSF